MTFKNLQDDLIAEIETLTKDVVTKNNSEETVVGLKGYAHRLPIIQSDDEGPDQYFPFFIVRIDNGRTRDDDDCWHIVVDVIIGIHDSAYYAGHEHLLVVIQRIVDRFSWDPQLAHMYRADQDIQWTVAEDDTYPFYYGAVEISFSTPKIGRKADYDV